VPLSTAPLLGPHPGGGSPRATVCAVVGWYAFGALLLFAALDERFMFHEAIAYHTTSAWLAGLPMLAYGLTGALVLRWWWRTAPMARGWMLPAAAFAIAAIVMDLANRAVAPQITEELLELAAFTAMLGGLLTTARSSRS
jgi:hypothetical protein